MCKPDNIQKMTTFASFMKVIQAIFLMTTGGMLASTLNSTVEFQLAYGTGVVDIAGGLIFVGLLLLPGSCLGYYGTRLHNKFLLLIMAIWDTILLVIQLGLAAGLVTLADSEYDADFREDCIRRTPSRSDDKCYAYTKSDRYIGMKLVWAAKFKAGLSEPNDINDMQDWESQNECCGFGPPRRCVEDENAIPDYLSVEGVPSAYSKQGTVCGEFSGWYPASGIGSDNECVQFSDGEFGGCKFEMPAGSCRIEDITQSTKGCGAWLQTKMDEDMLIRGYLVYLCCSIEMMSIIFSCCHFWKRRESETLPAYLEAVPWDPYRDKKKDQEVELVD